MLDSDFPLLIKKGLRIENVSFYPLQVEKESEPEEETDEDEGPAPVVVENESYVNLKKKISKRYDWQAKSVHAENAKICKQFRIKQVGYSERMASIASLMLWMEGLGIGKLWLPSPVYFWFSSTEWSKFLHATANLGTCSR